jgi:hypothetical protein
MQTNQLRLVKTVAYYDPLLQRYARRVVQDEEAAAHIVMQVLEAQYEINGLVPAEHLRQVLKTDVLNRCYYWKQSQIFNKVPKGEGFTGCNSNEDNPLVN